MQTILNIRSGDPHFERLAQFGYKSYDDYLASDEWRRFKSSYKKAGLPQRCIVCNDEHYELHHVSYNHLCDEWFCDVIPLCRCCHQKLHDYYKGRDLKLWTRLAPKLSDCFGVPWADMNARLKPFRKWRRRHKHAMR